MMEKWQRRTATGWEPFSLEHDGSAPVSFSGERWSSQERFIRVKEHEMEGNFQVEWNREYFASKQDLETEFFLFMASEMAC